MRASVDMAAEAFSVQLSPTAWTQVGTVDTAGFSRLHASLNRLAQSLSHQPREGSAGGVSEAIQTQIDGLTVRYQVDWTTRHLLLLSVQSQTQLNPEDAP